MGTKIISRFRERPKTRAAWWAFGLGLGTLLTGPLLGTFAAVVVPAVGSVFGEAVGPTVGFLFALSMLVLLVAALAAGIRAFRQGERSWVMWVGFVPAMMTVLFWVFLVIGEAVVPH